MITGIMWLWFILTGISVLFVLYDLMVNTPAMGVMKPGWVLVTLYTRPLRFVCLSFVLPGTASPNARAFCGASLETGRGFHHSLSGRRRNRHHSGRGDGDETVEIA